MADDDAGNGTAKVTGRCRSRIGGDNRVYDRRRTNTSSDVPLATSVFDRDYLWS